MAATSIKSGGNVSFTVKVNGSAISDGLRVYSVRIERRINRIARAVIVILDGEPDTGDFAASSSGTFVPGATISIEGGYDSKNESLFQGIITGQSIRIEGDLGSALDVECCDAAVKMTIGRKNLTFSKQKDSDIMSSIIGTYSLSSSVTATTTTWPEQIQYYVSDWDFILARAEANGLVVTTINGKVTIGPPDANSSPVLTIGYGTGLMEFNADMNALTQLNSVKATSWDYVNQAITTGEATNNVPGPGNITSKKLSEVAAPSNYQLVTSANMESADLTNWSKAQLIKSEYSKIQGTAKFQGNNLVDIATYITLQGLGDRFNGNHLVSGIVHDLSGGNWLTEVSIGLSPVWFTEEVDVMAPPASGLIPGARGLFNGTVKQMYNDPNNQFRILVNVPLFDPNGAGIWARLANFYSTNNAGAFFMPEVGDEVVLGFLNEDPRYPVILGSLYSSSKLKPYTGLTPAEKNPLKAIVSKSGIYIQFDDDNKVLTIVTPQKNTVILSDKEKQITIQDQNSNSIVMSGSGIVMKSPKDITIQADGNLNLKGTQGVKVESSGGDVQTSGMNIKESAQSQFSAQGSLTAQVQGGTELTLKGAMVMIN